METGFRSRLILIGVGVTLFAIGQSLLFTIVAPMARATGLSEIQFGLVLTLASLPLVAAAPFWGRRSDRVGRKPIFVLGIFGSAVGTTLVALTLQARMAGWIPVSGLIAGLLFSRGLYAATASALYPSAGGYIADVTDFSNRAQGMAILGASNSLGAILGPLMVAALSFAGTLLPMYVAACLMAAGGVVALKMLKEPERHQKSAQAADLRPTDKRIRPFMLMWFAFFLVFSSVQLTTGFFIQDRLGVTDQAGVVRIASLCLVSMAVVITIMQAVVFQALRISPVVPLRVCAPAFAVALLAMSQAGSVLMMMTGFAILGVAFACATPGISGSASISVEAHQQGTASGYLSAANTTGAILGPLAGTSLYQIAPTAVMYSGAALFVIVSIYAFTIQVPVHRHRG